MQKQAKRIYQQQGFTLLELLMVIAVIGILATIAASRFQDTTNRARFVEVINATAPYKAAVEVCILRNNNPAPCVGGVNGIPANTTVATVNVGSVAVGANGVITATGGAVFGQNPPDYTLTPALGAAGSADGVTWGVAGTCQAAGLC